MTEKDEWKKEDIEKLESVLKECYYCGGKIRGKYYRYIKKEKEILYWHRTCWEIVVKKVIEERLDGK
ncbi:MAG: hypothetical protein ACFFG0_15420 [Candidatus Thorarchaeota archaeon]